MMMAYDRFYDSIVDALKGAVDATEFELCATDLLRGHFPGIAPMVGGSDSGMDGAIPDGDGEPFPLVCTTGEDVIGNLDQNLRQYIAKGRKQRVAVVATTQFLTPARIQNLYDKATELGFTLRQVFDGNGIAQELYHRPDLCQRLLRVTGVPPALSVYPRTRRPLTTGNVFGRSADIEWLHGIDSDRILLGQPGSGKTFLLHTLAREGWGLFAVTDDVGSLANSIRSEFPQVVILDDAHTQTPLLQELVRLRKELGTTFRIVATCWPGELDQVREVLRIVQQQIRELKPLDRDTMVEVVKQSGLIGPNELLREIVTQAQGNPGLAVTLADLCLKGGTEGVREVFSGEALKRQIRDFFTRVAGKQVTDVLGCFALGGKTGMSADDIAVFLKFPDVELRQMLNDLSQGGVLRICSNHCISVVPYALRFTLVRDTFFSDPFALDPGPLLAKVPDGIETLKVLVGARAYGGTVSNDLLRRLLRENDTADAWKEYAVLGAEQTKEALAERPVFLGSLSEIGLAFAPEHTIPMLLDASAENETDLHAKPEKPLRQIQDWIKRGVARHGEAIARRRILVAAIASWLKNGGNPAVAVHALSFAFIPSIEFTQTDPGSGMKITFNFAVLNAIDIGKLRALWPTARDILKTCDIRSWPRLLEMVHGLVYPHLPNGIIPADIRIACHDFAKEVIVDLLNIANGHPAVIRALCENARELGLAVRIEEDPDFEACYPTHKLNTDIREMQGKWKAEVERLSGQWKDRPSEIVLSNIRRYEDEAKLADHTWPRLTHQLCSLLAKSSVRPSDWFRIAVGLKLPADLVNAFLLRSVAIEDTNAEANILVCLSTDEYKGLGLAAVLMQPVLNKDLYGKVTLILDKHTLMLDSLVLQDALPESTLRVLLSHEKTEVAETAAMAMWKNQRETKIPETLKSEWRSAVIRSSKDTYWIKDILKGDHALAFEWLAAHLDAENMNPFLPEDMYAIAASMLSKEQRIALIQKMPGGVKPWSVNLASELVQADIDVYRVLLARPDLRIAHLKPLVNGTKDKLAPMLKEAAAAGYGIRQMARAVDGNNWSWSGNESEMWKKRLEKYAFWQADGDPLVQEVANELVRMATLNCQNALERERNESVYGYLDEE